MGATGDAVVSSVEAEKSPSFSATTALMGAYGDAAALSVEAEKSPSFSAATATMGADVAAHEIMETLSPTTGWVQPVGSTPMMMASPMSTEQLGTPGFPNPSSSLLTPLRGVAAGGSGAASPTAEDIIAYGGIADPRMLGIRSSDRLKAQPHADATQLEKARLLAEHRDNLWAQGTAPLRSFLDLPNEVILSRASKLGVSLGLSPSEIM